MKQTDSLFPLWMSGKSTCSWKWSIGCDCSVCSRRSRCCDDTWTTSRCKCELNLLNSSNTKWINEYINCISSQPYNFYYKFLPWESKKIFWVKKSFCISFQFPLVILLNISMKNVEWKTHKATAPEKREKHTNKQKKMIHYIMIDFLFSNKIIIIMINCSCSINFKRKCLQIKWLFDYFL